MNPTRMFRSTAALACGVAGGYMAFMSLVMVGLPLMMLLGARSVGNRPDSVSAGSVVSGAIGLGRVAGPTASLATFLLLAAHFLLPSDRREPVRTAVGHWLLGRPAS